MEINKSFLFCSSTKEIYIGDTFLLKPIVSLYIQTQTGSCTRVNSISRWYQIKNKAKNTMTSSVFLISLLLLSLSSAVFSDDASFQKLPIPGKRSGPEAFAFDTIGKAFFTGVSGGKILKYTADKGFEDFAEITTTS